MAIVEVVTPQLTVCFFSGAGDGGSDARLGGGIGTAVSRALTLTCFGRVSTGAGSMPLVRV